MDCDYMVLLRRLESTFLWLSPVASAKLRQRSYREYLVLRLYLNPRRRLGDIQSQADPFE